MIVWASLASTVVSVWTVPIPGSVVVHLVTPVAIVKYVTLYQSALLWAAMGSSTASSTPLRSVMTVKVVFMAVHVCVLLLSVNAHWSGMANSVGYLSVQRMPVPMEDVAELYCFNMVIRRNPQ